MFQNTVLVVLRQTHSVSCCFYTRNAKYRPVYRRGERSAAAGGAFPSMHSGCCFGCGGTKMRVAPDVSSSLTGHRRASSNDGGCKVRLNPTSRPCSARWLAPGRALLFLSAPTCDFTSSALLLFSSAGRRHALLPGFQLKQDLVRGRGASSNSLSPKSGPL